MTLNPVKMFWRILRWTVILFFASSVVMTIVYRWMPVPFTPLMVIRCLQHIGSGEAPRLKHKWVPLSEISPSLPRAVMSSEDQRFLNHNGFDTKAIGYALRQRLNGRARWRGKYHFAANSQKRFFVAHSSWVRKGLKSISRCSSNSFGRRSASGSLSQQH